ncbi:tubulin binding cofactor C-domain-containing protein [Dichotomocladium elegans]|nr:tubulin binding cofactor C-domain-containing protein [Dichotomocladium elegans]
MTEEQQQQPSATEASNSFYNEFKVERQAIEEAIERSTSIPKDELGDHFNMALRRINQLEKELTKATEYIPSYDERQYSRQIKELTAILESAKSSLTPKPKFSFKSRRQKKEPAGSSTDTIPAPQTAIKVTAPTAKAAYTQTGQENIISFSNVSDEVIHLEGGSSTATSVDVLLSNLTRCVVLLRDHPVSALHIKNLSECVVVCGNIQGSVLMYGFTKSIIAIGCHQFRMHEARHVDVLLNVTSSPIIEDSADIRVTSYQAIPEEGSNLYDKVEDFNWLKRHASPNWRVLEAGEAARLNLLIETLSKENATGQRSVLLSGLSQQ